MSYIIDVRTENLNEMNTNAHKAINLVEEATAKLNKISSHKGWTCREKQTIDANTYECVKDARRITEDLIRFSNAVSSLKEKYVDAEKKTISNSSILDDIIGGLIWIKAGISVNTSGITSKIKGIFKGFMNWLDSEANRLSKQQSYIVKSALEPIHTCKFPGIYYF